MHSLKNFIIKTFKDPKLRDEFLLQWMSYGLIIFLCSFYFTPSYLTLKWIFALSFIAPLILVFRFNGLSLISIPSILNRLLILYAFMSFISTFWSPSPKAFDRFYEFLFFACFILGTSWLGSRNKIDNELICRSLTYVGAVVGPVVLLIFYSNHPLTTRLWPDGLRLGPTNSILIGVMYSVTSAISFYFLIHQKTIKGFFINFILTACNTLTVVASQSRGALLSLMLVIFITFIFSNLIVIKKLLITLLISSLVIFSGYYLLKNPIPYIAARVNDDGYRKEIWQAAISNTLQNNPWFGAGRGRNYISVDIPNYGTARFSHAHNQFIDSYYFTGSIGLLLFIAIILYVIYNFSIKKELFILYIWFLVGFFSSLTGGTARIGFEFFLMFYWIPIALIAATLQQSNCVAKSR